MDEDVFVNKSSKDDWVTLAWLIILPTLMVFVVEYAIRGRLGYQFPFLIVQGFIVGLWVFMTVINTPRTVTVLDEGVKMKYLLFKEKFVHWSDIEWMVVFPSKNDGSRAQLKVNYLATPVFISYEASLALGDRHLKALGDKPMNQMEFMASKRKVKGSSNRRKSDFVIVDTTMKTSDLSFPSRSNENQQKSESISMVEVKGVSSRRINKLIWITRGYIFINLGLMYFVLDFLDLLDDIIVTLFFLVIMSGIFLPVSMMFSREEFRNVAPVHIDMMQIELKNDFLDELLRRRKEIQISDVEKVGLFQEGGFQNHGEAGQNPLRLIIYTKDGKSFNTGVKERNGLNQAMKFFEARGIPILGKERL